MIESSRIEQLSCMIGYESNEEKSIVEEVVW